MIPDEKARRHIARLARHYRLPADQSAASARLDAAQVLAAGAKSDEHAKAICAWLRQRYVNFPLPGTISTACDAVPVPVTLRPAARQCPRCSGSGWWYPTPGAVNTCPCRTVAS